MKPAITTTILLSLCIFVGMYSCDVFLNKPMKPALVPMTAAALASHEWSDDLDLDGLEPAVLQSISYYRSLPDSKRFRYGGITYTPQEMAASLGLFLRTIRDYDGEDLTARLRERFLFFESRNAEGEAFFTGYYEPILEGSLEATDEFPEPVYAVPDDLIEVDLSLFSDRWSNEKIIGRLEGNRLVPYDSREEIMYDDSLRDRARPIAYVNDIELFFLQIQGSGLVRFPDGSVKRVNYAGKNGRPYTSIGSVLKDSVPMDHISLQSIKQYLYANPGKVKDILSLNQSYVFFREAEEGPFGSMGRLLTPGRSIAMDLSVIPEGTLAFIRTELPVFENDPIIRWEPVSRFVVVQDRGSAIVDHGRVDIFFGHGRMAELLAGHMKQRGRVFMLVAKKEYLKSDTFRNY